MIVTSTNARRLNDELEEMRVVAEALAKGSIRSVAVSDASPVTAGVMLLVLKNCLKPWVSGGQVARLRSEAALLLVERCDGTTSAARAVSPESGDNTIILVDAMWTEKASREDLLWLRSRLCIRPSGWSL